jgi:transposase
MYLLIMAIRPDALPTDAAALTEMVLALDAENEKLRVVMQTLKEMIFGKRSERLAVIVAEQLALELDDLETGVTPPAPANDDAAATKPAGKPRKKARRNIGALPKHLPRCEQVLEPDATACPCCDGRLHKIGEDVSEVLDVIPAILRVLRTIRPKYACRGCTDGVVQAKVLPRLIESGMASTALVTHVVVSKFAWYLPLYRQVQILAGQGLHLDRATLAGWVKRAAWWLKSLYELQLRTIQASPRLFCDETPMPVLDPGRHRTRICQFWAHAMDDRPWMGRPLAAGGGLRVCQRPRHRGDRRTIDRFFRHSTGGWLCRLQGARPRSWRRDPARFLSRPCPTQIRRGVQDDAVAICSRGDRTPAGGLRHRGLDPREAEIRGSSAEQRLAARRTRTAPLMETLRTRLTAMVGQLFSQSKLAEAINYALNHWDGLTLFLSDGRVEVDSNTVERSMRPIAMGRRNSLFSGSEGGAESWAILASLVNTAKLHDLDPQADLADVLERFVSRRTKSHQLHELLAWNWKAAHARIAQVAA